MNLIKFVKQCKKIDRELDYHFKNRERTYGLCSYILDRISLEASDSFENKFRKGSPFPCSGFWLGYPASIEGYNNRKKYLRKFMWWSILTLRFLRY